MEAFGDFKPWTTLNLTYIGTFYEEYQALYNATNIEQEPYDEGEWSYETLSKKVFSEKYGGNKPWKPYSDETIFETEREF